LKIAVISDIHGNLTALEAVLRDVAGQNPDATICLGDLAYKGPQPAECTDRIRQLGIPCVHGNTDLYLLHCANIAPTRPLPEDVNMPGYLQWHVDRLGPDHLAYLAGLPFDHRIDVDGVRIRFVHANPQDAVTPLRPTSPLEKIQALTANVEADWLVMGHIHSPFVFRFAGNLLVNTGAVGFSLDYDWRASWALLDTATGSVTLRRVTYSIDDAVAAAEAAGFPFGADWYRKALQMGYHI
jgi:putative phosphoesterase